MPGRSRSRSGAAGGRPTLAVVVALGLLVQGCGGSGDAGAIQSSVKAYIAGLAHRSPASVCAVITPAFWAGTEQDLNGQLTSAGVSRIPKLDCRAGFTRYFAAASRHSSQLPAYSVRTTSAHGDRGVETIAIAGSRHQFKLLKGADGTWRIDCCAGSQVQQQPTTTYRVPSGAMEPTLKLGQMVTSDNAAMRDHPPVVGDIIVFHPPAGADSASVVCANRNEGIGKREACDKPTARASSQIFIKRVVGVPSDRIAISKGHVIRNGAPESDAYITPCGGGSACDFPTPITIPAGEYFVLGDNRGESDDSRFWGPVKRAWILGLVRP